MKPRPSLDRVEELLAQHRGGCRPQPCDGCDLAAEVVALLRLVRMVTEPQPVGLAQPEMRLVIDSEPPRYPHDCSDCLFLGRYETADLYYCPQQMLGWPTLLARKGPHGADYDTWNVALAGEPLEQPFITAVERARHAGLDLKPRQR